MLSLEKVVVKIGGSEILRDVTMDIPKSSFVALVGRNGAGKTTVMRSIMNLLPIQSGEIRIDGRVTTNANAHEHARNGIGYMPEDRRLVPDWTVDQNVMLPAWSSQIVDAKQRLAMIYDLIPEIARFGDRKAIQLSGGQQKLVALGRAYMAGQNLLILDEPFEGVAPALVQRLVDIMLTMRKEAGLSVLISESDAVYSRGLVDRMYAIERGRVSETKVAPGELH